MNQKGIVQWIVLVILAIALPATLLLVRQTQILKPKAQSIGQPYACNSGDIGQSFGRSCTNSSGQFCTLWTDYSSYDADTAQYYCIDRCGEPCEAPLRTPRPPQCTDDLYYWDYNANSCIHKHGGYFDGSNCVYSFDPNQPRSLCPDAPPEATTPPAPGQACNFNGVCEIGEPLNSSICSDCPTASETICSQSRNNNLQCWFDSDCPGTSCNQTTCSCTIIPPPPPPPPPGGQPDLIVDNLATSATNPQEGDTTYLGAIIRNIGNAGTNPQFQVGFRIDGTPIGERTVEHLDSGAEQGVTLPWTAVAGNHIIFEACADSWGVIAESNESNNCAEMQVNVSSSSQPPPPPPPPPPTGGPSGVTVSISPTGNVHVYVNNPYDIAAYAIGNNLKKIEIWAKKDGGTDQRVAFADDFINPSAGSQGDLERSPPSQPLVAGQGAIVSGCREQVLVPNGTPLFGCWIYNVKWRPTEIGNYTVYLKVSDINGPVCDTSRDNNCSPDPSRVGNDVKFTANVTSGRYRADGLRQSNADGFFSEFINCVEDPSGPFTSYYDCAKNGGYQIYCCNSACQPIPNQYTGLNDACWLHATPGSSIATYSITDGCGPSTCHGLPPSGQSPRGSIISGPGGPIYSGGGYLPGYGSGGTGGGTGALLPPGMYECRNGTFVPVSQSTCQLPNYCVNIGNVGLNLPGIMPQCWIDDCASGHPTGQCIGGGGGSCPAGQNNPHRVWSGPGCIGIPGCGPNECEYGQTRTSPITPTYACNPVTRICSQTTAGIIGPFADLASCNSPCSGQSLPPPPPPPPAGTSPQSVRIINVSQGQCNDNVVGSGRLFATNDSQNRLIRNPDGTFSLTQSWDVTTTIGTGTGIRTVCAKFYSDTSGSSPLGSVFSGDINYQPIITPPPPPPPPPSGGGCTASNGDANRDGDVTLVDHNIWRDEYLGRLSTKTADFNCDGNVTLIDHNIWRDEFRRRHP